MKLWRLTRAFSFADCLHLPPMLETYQGNPE